ncbi:formate/nitrite transporter family protein [Algimonas arctica]|nr:formate/nitrite transporter family protein [Algimonas arctica]
MNSKNRQSRKIKPRDINNEVAEEDSVKDAAELSSKLIYEVIRRDGAEELSRPLVSLLWSGVAAGMIMGLSVIGEAIFRTHMPDTPARFLVENLGYSLGFLVVILGRMQLFTENTITTVLPLMAEPTLAMFTRVVRLWAVVLAANVVGAFVAGIFFMHTSAIPPELLPAMLELSKHALDLSAEDAFMRAIPAGILIAAIVWMLPQAKFSAFFVILIFTWLIAAGEFSHIIAGSVEMAILVVTGNLDFQGAVIGFFLPVLAGNIVGGTAIFTMMAWGQVRHEV